MAKYDGKDGEKPCYDCGVPATEYLGRRIKTPTGRTHLYTCEGCGNARLGKKSTKPAEPQSTPTTTRLDIFKQGHDGPKYTQGSLFDE